MGQLEDFRARLQRIEERLDKLEGAKSVAETLDEMFGAEETIVDGTPEPGNSPEPSNTEEVPLGPTSNVPGSISGAETPTSETTVVTGPPAVETAIPTLEPEKENAANG
jgi:hypothetical protein